MANQEIRTEVAGTISLAELTLQFPFFEKEGLREIFKYTHSLPPFAKGEVNAY